ncbi:MAG: Uma2 family endonuclease [Pirellulales bacterium]|nr:Uma2 family endonuclease [Pirellulales bacterium]
MSTALVSSFPTDWTAADMQEHLGGIPLDRIRMVPPPGTATEEDVLAVHARTGRLCELVDGTLVEKVMGYRESRFAVVLGHFLETYLDAQPLGSVAGADGMLRLFPGMIRIPDLSFILWERFPDRRLPRQPIPPISPDLAVEVLSEGNTEPEMQRKLHEYFRSGTRLVWYIDPQRRTARTYTAPGQWAEVDENGFLSGGDLLPGFQLRLGDLFDRAEGGR